MKSDPFIDFVTSKPRQQAQAAHQEEEMSKPERTPSQRLADATGLMVVASRNLQTALEEYERLADEWDNITGPLHGHIRVASARVAQAQEELEIAVRRLEGAV